MTSHPAAREPSAEALRATETIMDELPYSFSSTKPGYASVSRLVRSIVEKSLRQARAAAYERAARAVCPYCNGQPGYSRTPKLTDGDYVHLTKSYPPRSCRAAGIWRLAAEERA